MSVSKKTEKPYWEMSISEISYMIKKEIEIGKGLTNTLIKNVNKTNK